MCLIVNRDIHDILHCETEPFIAQHNILVFKQLYAEGFFQRRYKTPYMDYPVKFNHRIAEIGISHPLKIDSIHKLHFTVNEGIHSTRKFGTWQEDMPNKFYLAVIPKGATYYVGTHNDMVSDCLIIFKNYKAYLKFLEEGNSIITAEELYG